MRHQKHDKKQNPSKDEQPCHIAALSLLRFWPQGDISLPLGRDKGKATNLAPLGMHKLQRVRLQNPLNLIAGVD